MVVSPVRGQEVVDQAQPRPRGAETGGLLRGARDLQLARDLETLVRQEVEARGLTNEVAPIDAPRFAPDQMRRIAWWGGTTAGTRLTLADLLSKAAGSSLQIGVFSELPSIRETSIAEARGRYTPEFFAEGRYANQNEPTTSLAQTRGSHRLNEEDSALEFGVRKRLRSGAEVTLSQRFNNLETNLIDYNPRQQTRSRTVLGVVQPLLREGGLGYNDAVVNIAKLETEVAKSEFARQAEGHLLEVVRGYWTLYLARAVLAQQQRSIKAVDDIVARIQNRSGLDGLTLQLNRAKAVAAERRAALVRAESAVRNAESRLRALVNNPALGENLSVAELPSAAYRPSGLKSLAEQALAARPEIRQGLLAYRSALLREGMSANEALPRLDLVLEGSINGRGGNYALGDAFRDARDEEASYLVGVRASVPLGHDERKARYTRRRIETNQQALQLRATVETVLLETQVASNEYSVAYAEMMRRAEALQLATEDQRVLTERYTNGIGSQGTTDGILFLDRLLDAQTRVSNAERELAEAEATFQVAAAAVARARGGLLADLGFQVEQTRGDDGLPRYRLVRSAA